MIGVSRTLRAVPTALHLAPHPDDELIGAPATLLFLRDAGFRIVNLACSLGRLVDRERRRSELTEACRRIGFNLEIVEPPAEISSGDELSASEAYLTQVAREHVERLRPSIVLSPSPHDGARGHELVGRVARNVLRGGKSRWWMWGVWAELPLPTIVTLFSEERLDEILSALAAHTGELGRNDYRVLVRSRAEANSILAAERVFGFGAEGLNAPLAEVVTEAIPVGDQFMLGAPRVLSADNVLDPPTKIAIDSWLDSRSVRDCIGR